MGVPRRSLLPGGRAEWPVYVARLLALLLIASPPGSAAESVRCAEARQALGARGFSLAGVPHHPIDGKLLSVCVAEHSCCTLAVEENLGRQASLEFEELLAQHGHVMHTTLANLYIKFQEFFRELQSNAEHSLSAMFHRTYGALYVTNAELFSSLFSDLRSYYESGAPPAELSLSDFWQQLLERMFRLLNPHYKFNDAYMECVAKHAERLRPFGEVPRRLRSQLGPTMVVARAFVQGLALGREVATRALQVPLPELCSHYLTQMGYCQLCAGHPSLHPCPALCLSVSRSCLSGLALLDHDWNKYIDAMLLVAKRLESPFNIEAVLDPIDVKISDAIMNMQENSIQFSDKVFAGCGRPSLNSAGRTARDLSDPLIHRFRPYKPEERPTTAAGTSLDRLVSVVKDKLASLRGCWSSLPHAICSDDNLVAPSDAQSTCWDGREESSVSLSARQNGTAGDNVERDRAVGKAALRWQAQQLRSMTARLEAAYHGRDTDFMDTDDEASGSGSGQEPLIPTGAANRVNPSVDSSPKSSAHPATPLTSICLVFCLLLSFTLPKSFR
uniref:glypican-6-like n=1 Tax=Myxine glutinosa TaxID=7769 RepID=UPI00358F2A21